MDNLSKNISIIELKDKQYKIDQTKIMKLECECKTRISELSSQINLIENQINQIKSNKYRYSEKLNVERKNALRIIALQKETLSKRIQNVRKIIINKENELKILTSKKLN